jgi:CelD/BcsL family acetyltransferase involved in cellulose biosynthesis
MGSRHPLQERARVTFARGSTELECLVPAWEELARNALEPNPFYEPWMLLPALRAFGAGHDLRVALVWSGYELAGLFPLERVARYKALPAAALSSWRHAHCLLGTPLVRAGRARLCLDALLDQSETSLLEFSYVPAGEPFHRALLEALEARGLRAIVNRSYERGLLRKHRGTVSAQLRRRLAKNERDLRKHGEFAYVELRPQDDIARWIGQFLELEAAGWKGREGSAMACSPANRGYFAQIIEAAFRRGRLLACGLDLGARPLARRFSFTAGEAAYAFKIAYDEAFAEASPGVMLERHNLRQVDADPRLQWMDSFSDGANLSVERMWPDRRTMQTLAAATGAWGGLAVAALPALRWLKHRLG